MNNALFIILVNAIILAAGILVVLIACFTFDNFFPLLTILVDLIAILQLMGCGACAGNSDSYLMFSGDDSNSLVGLQVSWMLFGLLVVVGYAIPALLFRGSEIPEVALYFTWVGGTTILAAMIIYMKIIYVRGSQ